MLYKNCHLAAKRIWTCLLSHLRQHLNHVTLLLLCWRLSRLRVLLGWRRRGRFWKARLGGFAPGWTCSKHQGAKINVTSLACRWYVAHCVLLCNCHGGTLSARTKKLNDMFLDYFDWVLLIHTPLLSLDGVSLLDGAIVRRFCNKGQVQKYHFKRMLYDANWKKWFFFRNKLSAFGGKKKNKQKKQQPSFT